MWRHRRNAILELENTPFAFFPIKKKGADCNGKRKPHSPAQEDHAVVGAVLRRKGDNYAAAFHLQCSSLVALAFTSKLAAVEKRFLDGHAMMFLEHI